MSKEFEKIYKVRSYNRANTEYSPLQEASLTAKALSHLKLFIGNLMECITSMYFFCFNTLKTSLFVNFSLTLYFAK